jgi:hypothetical protein
MTRDWVMKSRACTVEGCSERRKVRGLCNRHYQAWYREHRAEQKRRSDRRWRERVGYNARRRKPRETRVCPVCGAEFVARTWNHTYCTGFRGRCYRRAMNARYRGRQLIEGKVGEPFDCAQCGERCVPGENVAPHASKFCGRHCKRAWLAERERGHRHAGSAAA